LHGMTRLQIKSNHIAAVIIGVGFGIFGRAQNDSVDEV